MTKLPFLFILLASLFVFQAKAQSSSTQTPKLVVGVVVDQMRFDYLYRFQDDYSEKGFKRLLKEGANFSYAHFNYIPTYTAPGHACVYTGSSPYKNGIIGNHWYSYEEGKEIYCVTDTLYKTLGATNDKGQCSPYRLMSTTLGDALKMSNNSASKVFGISIKDRGAVIPAGFMGDGAYWYDASSGKMISSSYYRTALPKWVEDFNKKERVLDWMDKDWETLLPLERYSTSFPDEAPGEVDVFKEGDLSFPHHFRSLKKEKKWELLPYTPYGNRLLTEMAMELIEKEELGKDNYTDLLSISYSSPDYIGHCYGPNSVEIRDTYLRLDAEIAQLLDYLDEKMGKGNYILFLTADHGVKPNGKYLDANRIPAGDIESTTIQRRLRQQAQHLWQDSMLVKTVYDNQIYLDREKLASRKISASLARQELVECLRNNFKQINTIHTKEALDGFTAQRGRNFPLLNGMHPSLSGDIVFELQANYTTGSHDKGTTHGSAYDYDTHVPLLFFGGSIAPMRSREEVYIVDIAPTLAQLLNIMEPDGCIGKPLF
jgi:predicted AlkP superfamily pyrophosphatase or phosphodiesterase